MREERTKKGKGGNLRPATGNHNSTLHNTQHATSNKLDRNKLDSNITTHSAPHPVRPNNQSINQSIPFTSIPDILESSLSETMTNQKNRRAPLKDLNVAGTSTSSASSTNIINNTDTTTSTTSQCKENDSFEKCDRRHCRFNDDDGDAADCDGDSKKELPDTSTAADAADVDVDASDDKESPTKKQKRVAFLFHDDDDVDIDVDHQDVNANNVCSSSGSDDMILMPPPAPMPMTRGNNIEFANGNSNSNGNCNKEKDHFDINITRTATRARARSNAIDLSSSYPSPHNSNHTNGGGGAGGGQDNDGTMGEEEDGIDITLYDSHTDDHNHLHLHHYCGAMPMQDHSHGVDMNIDMDHIDIRDMQHAMPQPISASTELDDSTFERNDIDTCNHHHQHCHLDDDDDERDHGHDHGCILARNPDIHQEEDVHEHAQIHSHVDILCMEESLQRHRQGDDDEEREGEDPNRDVHVHDHAQIHSHVDILCMEESLQRHRQGDDDEEREGEDPNRDVHVHAHVDILNADESLQHHRQDDDDEEQEGEDPHRDVHEHDHAHAQIHSHVDMHQDGEDEEQGGGEVHQDVQQEGNHLHEEQQQQHPNEDTNANSNGSDSDSGSSSKLKPTITTRFSDIIGHGAAKLRLDEMLLPLALPPYISQQILIGVRAAPASILLYGPPGTGKTKLAQAVAGEAGAAFLSIGPSDVLSKFVGESEAAVKDLFRRAKVMAEGMESRCAVVFFDEIDALGMSRGGGGEGGGGGGEDSSAGHSSRKILAELLIQLSLLSDEASAGTSGCCTESSEEAGTDIGDTGPGPDIDSDSGIVQEGSDSDCGLDSESASGNEIINEDENDRAHGECSGKISNKYNNGHGIMMHDNQPRTVSEPNTRSHERASSPPSQRPRPRVIVIAATNRPEDCDAALLRRFSIRVLVGLPSQRDRRRILSRLLEGIENTITPADLKELSVATEGWSGSDLESVTREAVMAPIRECLRSAALLKMNTRKRASGGNKRTMASSNDSDGTDAARDELLNKFRKLRPVTMQDFEEAIAFWIGDGQEDMTAQMTNQASACHYDSDSSFDENE